MYEYIYRRGSATALVALGAVLTMLCGGVYANDNPALGIGEPNTTPDPPPDDPDCDSPPCDDCNGSGSPLFVSTGAFFKSLIDLDYGLGKSPPFNIARRYTSNDFYVGYFGRGFHSSLDMMSIPTFKGQSDSQVVVVRWPDGQRAHYTKQPDQSYSGMAGSFDTLTKVSGGFDVRTKDNVIYHFAADTTLQSIVDHNGNTVSFTYDASRRPQTITLPGNRQIDITFNANGFVDSVADFAGRTVSYSYDQNGYLTGYVDAESNSAAYQYTGGRMTAILDHLGRTTTSVTYDAQGRVSRLVDADGDFTYAYLSATSTRKTDNANGAQWTYTLDANGVVTRITGPNGFVRNFTYNATYNLISSTDGNNNPTSFSYNSQGLPVTVTDARGGVTSYTYNAQGLVTSITDSSGVATFEYDAAGNVTRMQDPIGNVMQYAYDAKGFVTSITDPNGHSRTMTYDSLGYPLTRTNEAGMTTTYVHDSLGNLLSITTPAGTTSYEYDNLQRRTRTTDPMNGMTLYSYEGGSGGCRGCGEALVASITDPAGNVTSMTYDRYGRLLSTTDPLLNVTMHMYDSHGWLTSTTDAESRTTSYAYDLLGNRTLITEPGSGQTQYGYDLAGNLTSLRDARNNQTTFTYDNLNRATRVVSPDTGTTNYGYDAMHLTTRTDGRGITTMYRYDGLGRLTAIQYPNSALNVTLRYDEATVSNGKLRLTGIVDPTGETILHYDPVGMVTREVAIRLGVTYETLYEFTGAGFLSKVVYPTGTEADFTFGGPQLPSSATVDLGSGPVVLASNMAYDLNGNRTDITLGNGIAESREYDGLNRPTAITAGTLFDYAYSYSPAGNILSIADAVNPSDDRAFGYDSLDRVTSASGIWGAITYTYDLTGNRMSATSSSGTLNYSYTGNRLTMISGAESATFTSDAIGNITSDGAFTYTFGDNGRLTSVSDPAAVASYAYDYLGQRGIKITASETAVFHYDVSGNLIAETEADGTPIAEYIYLPDGHPLAIIQGGAINYYHADHLRTPVMATDGAGAVAWQADLLPFGGAFAESGALTQNIRFPGQYRDLETALHYNMHRTYAPALGRYLEPDPAQAFDPTIPDLLERFLALPQELNRYVYTANNPIKSIDPEGLVCGSGWNDAIVPDSWWGQYDFTNPCQNHDDCYGKCGTPKCTCDDNFQRDMYAECAKIKSRFWRFCCRFTARQYRRAVKWFGGSAYNDAQKDCCKK